MSLTIQARVEAAILDQTPLAGVSVDIIKCFNQLPRAPLAQLLRHLRVPDAVITLWIFCLRPFDMLFSLRLACLLAARLGCRRAAR